jgi:hypothetical protein
MPNESLLSLGYNLLKELGIAHMHVLDDRLELEHTFGNQKIIAYGQTEKELVENFYSLYLDLKKSA